MADTKLSGLTTTTSLTSTDRIYVVQSTATTGSKRASWNTVKSQLETDGFVKGIEVADNTSTIVTTATKLTFNDADFTVTAGTTAGSALVTVAAGGGGGGGGMWTQIANLTGTSTTQVDIDLTGYDEYYVVVNFLEAASGSDAVMRLTTDGFSTVESGSNYYGTQYRITSSGISNDYHNGLTVWYFGRSQTNGSNRYMSGHFWLRNLGNASYYTHVDGVIKGQDGVGNERSTFFNFVYRVLEAHNGIRMYRASSGSWGDYDINVFGRDKA